jgi:hypothetical protein
MGNVTAHPDDLLGSRAVCATFNVTDMTLWRWSRDPKVQFPPPDVVIRGRRYWRRDTIEATKRRLSEATAETTGPRRAAALQAAE